jgi:hypothetical protein
MMPDFTMDKLKNMRLRNLMRDIMTGARGELENVEGLSSAIPRGSGAMPETAYTSLFDEERPYNALVNKMNLARSAFDLTQPAGYLESSPRQKTSLRNKLLQKILGIRMAPNGGRRAI